MVKNFSIDPPHGTTGSQRVVETGNEDVPRIEVLVETRALAHFPESHVMAALLVAPLPERTHKVRITNDDSGRIILVCKYDLAEYGETYTGPKYFTESWAYDDNGWTVVDQPNIPENAYPEETT